MSNKNKKKINVPSWLTIFNQSYINQMYENYLKDINSVPLIWRNEFLKLLSKKNKINILKKNNEYYKIKYIKTKIIKIINFFRIYGYKYANINPLNIKNNKNKFKKIKNKYIKIFNKIQLNNDNIIFKKKNNIKYIFKKFKKLYSNTIGFEFKHLSKLKEQKWIQNYIEKKYKNFQLSNKKKKYIYKILLKTELFEKNLNIKFPGTKRFSLEGSDTFILLLQTIINICKKKKKKKIIIGMAHRGRLNVLINILKKKLSKLFIEFSNSFINFNYSDDVKYHKGKKRSIKLNNNINMIIKLLNNPSHLEIINPVVIGVTRAYIDKTNDNNYLNVLPIIVHGDAAICGQGIVQETLNMSQTRGYKVGGTINIVINNQIGFTTSNKKDLRSSKFCTDIGKIIDAPIFHVNADDPESVIFVTKIALKFRDFFKKDIFIDLVSYRRQGHNEIDNPYYTQPIMYKKIDNHLSVIKLYQNKLISQNIINNKYIIKETNKYNIMFNKEYLLSINILNNKNNLNYVKKKIIFKKKKIIFKKKKIKQLAIKINTLPKNINIHKQVKKIYNLRKKMSLNKILFDWGAAENLAYAILLKKKISCRLSGEDIIRGTFSHRHCAIYDQKHKKKYIPLQNISDIQGKFEIWNSTLSESSVLAFEYGYANIQKNKKLTLWEAQFGDFINGAQIVIDQFISSGEQKWNQLCNLVILLPHGYEGQGPEHSSARIERFLQLCAEKNIQICIPSNPSQIYHLILRQIFKKILKPLIIFSPKSLLRHPLAKSKFKDLYNNHFLTIISDLDKFSNKLIKRVVFCSGKIYYDLLIKRRKRKIFNITIIRIEQLYPFPKKKIYFLLKLYKHIKDFIWCQEEPYNQGFWNYIYPKIKKLIPYNTYLKYIGRPSASSSAVGGFYMHQLQQKKIINQTLNIVDCKD